MSDQQASEVEDLERIFADASKEPIRISYGVIKSITNNFAQRIGNGAFGVVYLGALKNGKVAVKKLSVSTENLSEKQFLEEVKCLMRVKHPNIVRFLGYCAECHGEVMEIDGKLTFVDVQQRLLCFEYVPNGSLHDYLQEKPYGSEWNIRYQIIKGICVGLHYLHQRRIYHLDLKPGNVLLGTHMEPKITDFGLSRCIDENQSTIYTVNVVGTRGYMAPEFIDNGKISHKFDIYSLGIIMTRLLIGSNDGSITEFLHEELNTDCQQMKRCFEIAKECVEVEPDKRPTIAEIVLKLNETETTIQTAPTVVNIELRNDPYQYEERRIEYDLELNGPLAEFFNQGTLLNVLVLNPLCLKLVPLFHQKKKLVPFGLGDDKRAGILSWSFSVISVLCLVVLHLALTCSTPWIQKVTVLCWLSYLLVFLRIVVATFLLLLVHPVRHLVIILPLSLLVLVLLAYSSSIFNRRHTPGRYWREHQTELRLRFDLSSQVERFAYAGLVGGAVLGSNNQLLLSGRGYMAPDCFLSLSILLGLLVQLLSTVPSHINNPDTRRRMANVYLRIVAYLSLMFLVLGGVMAAEEILREWVFLACFIVIIPVLSCAPGPRPRYYRFDMEIDPIRHHKPAEYCLNLYFMLSFAALMASNSKYGIERGGMPAVSLSRWFKFSVLSVLHGVLSYAVRMVYFWEMPKMRSSALPTRVWTWSALATVPITILLVSLVFYMHPDDIKNIFRP